MKRTAHIFLTLALGTVFLVAARVEAQQSGSLGIAVSPPVVRIAVQPGKAISIAFNIENRGERDMSVTPQLVEFSADEETGAQIVHEKGGLPATLANTDKRMGTPFVLGKGGKDQLVLQFSFPENAKERDYYQTLLLKLEPAEVGTAETGASSQAIGYIGANLLISVSQTGEDNGFLQVEDLGIPKVIDMFSSLPVKFMVKNTGTTFTTVNGTVEISSLRGLLKTYPLLPEDVLSDSVREVHAAQIDPEDPRNRVPEDIVYKQPFFLGPYTVGITVHSPNQDPATERHTVWALPFSPILVFLGIFAVQKLVKKARRYP